MTGQKERTEVIETETIAFHQQLLGVFTEEIGDMLNVILIIESAMIRGYVLCHVIYGPCSTVLEGGIPLCR